MSEVIRLMETLAQAPAWFGGADYDALVGSMNVEGAQRDALMDRDVPALVASMGLSASMFCMVLTPDGGESEDEYQDEDDQSGDQPDEHSEG